MTSDLEKPSWLKIRAPTNPRFKEMRELIKKRGVSTVCTASRCPNVGECWGRGNATFMILGEVCTRSCGFCAVRTGNPGGITDPGEAGRIAGLVRELGLNHVVITSVARDDLPDGGAAHFSFVVEEVRKESPGTSIEILIPDFRGNDLHLGTVVDSRPDILGHNLETVERLQRRVRDRRASYRQSIDVLRRVKEIDGTILTKSSIMLGLGESEREVVKVMEDLRGAGVDLLTLGQYLRPRGGRLEITEYIAPQRFQSYQEKGLDLGFKHVAAGPFVRSSYRAWEALSWV